MIATPSFRIANPPYIPPAALTRPVTPTRQLADVQSRLQTLSEDIDRLETRRTTFRKRQLMEKNGRRAALPRKIALIVSTAFLGMIFVPLIASPPLLKNILKDMKREGVAAVIGLPFILAICGGIFALPPYLIAKYLLKTPRPDQGR